MTPDQSVNLRAGQRVRVKTFLKVNVIGTIARVTVTERGQRILEVEKLVSTDDNQPFACGRIFVGVTEVELL